MGWRRTCRNNCPQPGAVGVGGHLHRRSACTNSVSIGRMTLRETVAPVEGDCPARSVGGQAVRARRRSLSPPARTPDRTRWPLVVGGGGGWSARPQRRVGDQPSGSRRMGGGVVDRCLPPWDGRGGDRLLLAPAELRSRRHIARSAARGQRKMLRALAEGGCRCWAPNPVTQVCPW